MDFSATDTTPPTEHEKIAPTTLLHWQKAHGTTDANEVLRRFEAARAKTRRALAENTTDLIRRLRDAGLPRE